MSDLMKDRLIVAVGDRYDVQDELGRGGTAIVYRAVDIRLRRTVAIKVLPPDLAFRPDVRARFLREAETAAQLTHPSIVPIYTVDEQGGIVYFVMACVEGESLAQRLRRESRPPYELVRGMLRDVADALGYAHERGVIHRDIKPDNILIDRETGRTVVTDFGIARALEEDSRLTVTGIAVGTPAYMSPEQAMGERETDGRGDIYSLGVVGYLMLAGELPFQAANTPAMLMKHLSERPRPLTSLRRDLPPDLVHVVERALEKKPEERWQTAYAMRDALAAPGADVRRPARVSSPPPRAPAPLPAPLPAPPSGAEARRERWAARRERKRGHRESVEAFAERPVSDRITIVRREMVTNGVWIAALGVVNAMTSPDFPWVVFPAAFMVTSVFAKAGTLWAEGIRWRDIFGRRRTAPVSPPASDPLVSLETRAAQLLPPDVLSGRRAEAVRHALGDRAAIVALLAALPPEDRALLPEVMPTVDALVERTASLARTLHQLDADLAGGAGANLDARIAAVEREPEDAVDRERRLTLLKRQRATLHDLAERRERVASQLESARIALENLRFDLIKLRSAGVQSAIQDVNNATQEARALSRDIGHVADAAAEVRRL
jgi:serine/threonine-protein kinase